MDGDGGAGRDADAVALTDAHAVALTDAHADALTDAHVDALTDAPALTHPPTPSAPALASTVRIVILSLTVPLPTTFKTLARPLVFAARRAAADRAARRADRAATISTDLPVTFIIGCGRSGTTLLGRLLALHPDVHYTFEPYHVWGAIAPGADMVQLYRRDPSRCFMGAEAATDRARHRFHGLLVAPAERAGAEMLVEKTPVNTLRIGFLEALAPHARYVHIARDVIDVTRSIDRVARQNDYRIAGRPNWNKWWGVDDVKWRVLTREGAEAGYFEDAVARLDGHAQRGAYEWLVSHLEVDAWRARLGERLHECRYDDLVDDPDAVMGAMSAFLGLTPDDAWMSEAASMVRGSTSPTGETLALPRDMSIAVNERQERFGFPGRATPE